MPPPERRAAVPGPSLFRGGLGLRLLLAGAVSGLAWLVILWALAA